MPGGTTGAEIAALICRDGRTARRAIEKDHEGRVDELLAALVLADEPAAPPAPVRADPAEIALLLGSDFSEAPLDKRFR